jgi:hypothetical protein
MCGFTFDAAFLIRILRFFYLRRFRSHPALLTSSALPRHESFPLTVPESRKTEWEPASAETFRGSRGSHCKCVISQDVTPSSLVLLGWRSGRTYCLFLQGGVVGEASSKYSLCLLLYLQDHVWKAASVLTRRLRLQLKNVVFCFMWQYCFIKPKFVLQKQILLEVS